MARKDMEDFDFLDNLLSGSEDNLKEKEDEKPSSAEQEKASFSPLPSFNENTQDSLFEELKDEFSDIEDEFSEVNKRKVENKKPEKKAKHVEPPLRNEVKKQEKTREIESVEASKVPEEDPVNDSQPGFVPVYDDEELEDVDNDYLKLLSNLPFFIRKLID